jgi:signal transduction histidine kinase
VSQWAIVHKLILIFFIAWTVIDSESADVSWTVFSLLLYFCLNISFYLFKRRFARFLFLILSAILTVISSLYISPVFMLLLPLSIIELLLDLKLKREVFALVAALLPVFYVPSDWQALYVLAAVYTFLTYMMALSSWRKMAKQAVQLDDMRITREKLLKQINENDVLMKQSAYMYKLEERNRISQEIHDDVGHAITGALIQMEAAKKLLRSNPDKAGELLQNAIRITQDGIESIRFTLKNLKPSSEQVGINRLKLDIDAFAAKHDMRTLLTYQGNMERITPLQWKIIQENVTEALTNALKYAACTRIEVDVTVLNKLIRLVVKDNGKGDEHVRKGLGIAGMEERTAAIGGQILINGKQGFSVTTLIPVHHELFGGKM